MTDTPIISADSHVVEPADFWQRHIDKEYRARAPHAFTGDDGNAAFVVDGKPLGSVGAPSQVGLRFDEPGAVSFEAKWEDVRPGCSEPVPRLADMQRDGINGEVIFPTLGARLYGVIDGDRLPSDFFRTNIYLTFQEDKLGLDALSASIGVDTLMFGSDYPHAESTWPRSQQFLGELLADKTPGDCAKLTHDTAAALFGFDL